MIRNPLYHKITNIFSVHDRDLKSTKPFKICTLAQVIFKLKGPQNLIAVRNELIILCTFTVANTIFKILGLET